MAFEVSFFVWASVFAVAVLVIWLLWWCYERFRLYRKNNARCEDPWSSLERGDIPSLRDFPNPTAQHCQYETDLPLPFALTPTQARPSIIRNVPQKPYEPIPKDLLNSSYALPANHSGPARKKSTGYTSSSSGQHTIRGEILTRTSSRTSKNISTPNASTRSQYIPESTLNFQFRDSYRRERVPIPRVSAGDSSISSERNSIRSWIFGRTSSKKSGNVISATNKPDTTVRTEYNPESRLNFPSPSPLRVNTRPVTETFAHERYYQDFPSLANDNNARIFRLSSKKIRQKPPASNSPSSWKEIPNSAFQPPPEKRIVPSHNALSRVSGVRQSLKKSNVGATKRNAIVKTQYKTRPIIPVFDTDSDENDFGSTVKFNKLIDVDAESVCSSASIDSRKLPRDIREFNGWKEFKRKHLITIEAHPNHVSWAGKEWNEFAKEREISDDHVNSVISVSVEKDILKDFNPLNEKSKTIQEKGPVYQSRHKRRIFHLIPRKNAQGGRYFVVVKEEIRYLAAVTHSFGQKIGSYQVWLPIHFASFYVRPKPLRNVQRNAQQNAQQNIQRRGQANAKKRRRKLRKK